jgi:uncharacterized protein (TIGR03083 family)
LTLTRTDRIAMLKEISQAYLALDRLLAQIPDQALERPNTCGDWSGKEVIAHLGNWEDVLREYLIKQDAGEETGWPTATRANDEVNAELLAAYRALSAAEVRDQFRDAHFALMAVLETSPSVDPARATAVTKRHFESHRDDLAALRPTRGQ